MRRQAVLIGSVASFLFLSAQALALQEHLVVTKDDTHILVTARTEAMSGLGRPIFNYHYAGVPFKPYGQEFFTPAGLNLLRDAPHDHLHHHALMFALSANDVDFWSELDTCGKQIHKDFTSMETDPVAGVPCAGFTEQLEWVNAAGTDVIVKEDRTIRVLDMPETNASVVFWRTVLTAPGNAPVKLTGAHYFGLGMRFLESMDGRGKFINASNAEGEIVRGEERNFEAPWCAFVSEADGKPATAAMFGYPGNPRPVTWFTMPVPFSYLSATLNLHKEPMTLEPGKPLVLNYAVALWDGVQDAKAMGSLYGKWLKWMREGGEKLK